MEEKPLEEKKEKQTDAELPPPDFSTFIMSLSTSVLLYLGEVADPVTGEKEKNLPLARHTIDLLDMIKQKTKGNLGAEEEKLIESALHDLRMRYLKAAEEDAKKA